MPMCPRHVNTQQLRRKLARNQPTEGVISALKTRPLRFRKRQLSTCLQFQSAAAEARLSKNALMLLRFKKRSETWLSVAAEARFSKNALTLLRLKCFDAERSQQSTRPQQQRLKCFAAFVLMMQFRKASTR